MRYLLSLLLVTLGAGAAEPPPVAVTVPSNAEQLTQMVRAAVTTYTLTLQELGVTRKHPIKIKLSDSVSDFETHSGNYVVKYRDPEARWPNGLAYMDSDVLMIKAIPPYDQAALQRRVWHEMTHSLQYDLSTSNAPRARPWLAEGMADLYAFVAAGAADADSVQAWKTSLQRRLRDLNSPLQARDLLNIDQYDWDDLSDSSQGANYAVADLMVLSLYETNGAGSLVQLASYFDCLSAGLKPEASCFVEKIGATPEQFARR